MAACSGPEAGRNRRDSKPPTGTPALGRAETGARQEEGDQENQKARKHMRAAAHRIDDPSICVVRTRKGERIAGVLGELLNPPAVSIGGDGDTPQAAWIAPGVSYNAIHASVARYVFDLADWDNSGWIVPLGSSGHPGSRHYADQASLWSGVRLTPMLYSWERIIAGAETEQRLEPKT